MTAARKSYQAPFLERPWNGMFEAAPKAAIDCWHAVPGNEYRPEAYGQVCRVPFGICVHMACRERSPKAEQLLPNSMVCTDSCLEFFLNPQPGRSKFINFEMNAAGTLLLGVNEGGAFRCLDPALQAGCGLRTRVDEASGVWEAFFCVPDSLMEAVFPGFIPAAAFHMQGNFYKCGDWTEQPHYGSWNPVTREPVDFHCPECFGDIMITKEK